MNRVFFKNKPRHTFHFLFDCYISTGTHQQFKKDINLIYYHLENDFHSVGSKMKPSFSALRVQLII